MHTTTTFSVDPIHLELHRTLVLAARLRRLGLDELGQAAVDLSGALGEGAREAGRAGQRGVRHSSLAKRFAGLGDGPGLLALAGG